MIHRPLTDHQQRLVADNLGLVRVHLQNRVPGLHQPTREREWDDLFQEGCLGLAAAAQVYDPASAIPFASFALRRVQSAVHRALERSFATVALPENQHRARRRDRSQPFKVVSLDPDAPTRAGADRHRPDGRGETIGSRMRLIYDDAVQTAADIVRTGDSATAAPAAVIDRLLEHRLSIPNEDCRTPLRRVARECGCSFARVVYWENRLIAHVRTVLADSDELRQLHHQARQSPGGVDTPIDEDARQRFETAAADRFGHLFASLPADQQGPRLLELLRDVGADAVGLARLAFSRLDHPHKGKHMNRIVQLTLLMVAGPTRPGYRPPSTGPSSKRNHGRSRSTVAGPMPLTA